MSKNHEKITYGIYATQFGDAVIAQTVRGLCWLGFEVQVGDNEAYRGGSVERLQKLYPECTVVRDDDAVVALKDDILRAWEQGREQDITLDLRGTEFQRDVWAALLDIPKGEVRSYQDIANAVGRPKAVRAAGSAVGANPVSIIVPCHRVVRTGAGLGGYAWGLDIKRALLDAENAPLAA